MLVLIKPVEVMLPIGGKPNYLIRKVQLTMLATSIIANWLKESGVFLGRD